jgi:hypothetical protein
MINDKALIIVAIIAAVGLLGLAVVETMTWQQQAEAIGCRGGFIGFNASQGRCFRGL